MAVSFLFAEAWRRRVSEVVVGGAVREEEAEQSVSPRRECSAVKTDRVRLGGIPAGWLLIPWNTSFQSLGYFLAPKGEVQVSGYIINLVSGALAGCSVLSRAGRAELPKPSFCS